VQTWANTPSPSWPLSPRAGPFVPDVPTAYRRQQQRDLCEPCHDLPSVLSVLCQAAVSRISAASPGHSRMIAVGIDVRAVAGRLGYGDGEATTLRVYTAWLAATDKKAAGLLALRPPRSPRFRA
jgi:hypothetical protein